MAEPNLVTGTAGTPSTSAIPAYLMVWNGSTWTPMLGAAAGSPAPPSGAAHLASSQVAPTNVAGTLAIARATRVRCTLINQGSVTVYVDATTATTTDGRLLPGAAITLTTKELIAGITAAGTGAIDVWDEYN